ncbi:MAG: hypothetical protein HOK63_04220 [Thaumarchaeota archaeon]|jgi:ABC-type antimicrobial peptide transport system ATPase subunit|nr:hypothetical protein [Nitrososphaerota archaeon]
MIDELDEAIKLATQLDEAKNIKTLQSLKDDVHFIFDDAVKIISLIDHDKHDEAVKIQIYSLEPKVLIFDRLLNELSVTEQANFANEFDEFLFNVNKSTMSLVIFYIILMFSHTAIVIFITKSYAEPKK